MSALDLALAPDSDATIARRWLAHALNLPMSQVDLVLGALVHTRTSDRRRPGTDVHGAALCIVFDGWLTRTVMLVDGRRQIVDFLLPGDVVSLATGRCSGAESRLTNLTPARYATVSSARFQWLRERQPSVALRFQDAILRTECRLADQVLRLGRLGAYERTAHLLLDLLARLHHGESLRSARYRYHLPVTQEDLADALGLSAVHMNRVLRAMTRDRLVGIEGRAARTVLTVLDVERLADIAMYDPERLEGIVS
jgi:CRP-like cAMP-binding protein